MNKELILDLQMFNDDEENLERVDEVAEEVAEENTDVSSGEHDELMGISEETLAELKEEHGDFLKKDEFQQEVETPLADEPKEEVDYKAMYEAQQAELEQLKQRFMVDNTASPATNPIDVGLKLTPESNKLFEEIVRQRTMEIAGMTQEDVDGLFYLDEDDDKKRLFRNAETLARQEVVDKVQQQARIMQQQEQEAYRIQEACRQDITTFVNEIKATPNYEALDRYASTTFFNKLNPMEQQVVREAYGRANAGTPTYTDNVILRNFWINSTKDYEATYGANKKGNVAKKMAQRNSMPRSATLTGGNGTQATNWDIQRLEQALNSPDEWAKVPEAIRQRVLEGML